MVTEGIQGGKVQGMLGSEEGRGQGRMGGREG